jgi:hypothetical protein
MPCPSDAHHPEKIGSRETRLERGEILAYQRCPFALPEDADRQFLMEQEHARWGHKNISFNPHTGEVVGFRHRSAAQPERLRRVLAEFSRSASTWLAQELPDYARAWELDRASLRPEEEATRRLRLTARNDLLHVDAFPTRPTHGRRLLRLFVNFHPSEPRVWATAEPFARLLAQYGKKVGLPVADRPEDLVRSALPSPLSLLLAPFSRGSHSPYDLFMLRLHDYLKTSDDFQERSPKRIWSFPPGSAWLIFADGVAHAELRGRHALEHSYFIATEALALPEEAPAALLARACGLPSLSRAA